MVYRYLADHPDLEHALLVTVLTGEAAGAHGLFGDGRILAADPLFPDHFTYEAACAFPAGVSETGGHRIFTETLGGRSSMVICGGGHVATALLKLAVLTGFETYVLEDRPAFAAAAEENGADHILTGSFRESLRSIPDDEGRFYVVMTRGHRFDMECLEEILPRRPRYAGMMCSRRRVADARKRMKEAGLTDEMFDALHAPIGLPIGAETPEEIAVSVMAEVISVLRKNPVQRIPDGVLEILNSETPCVLAQIVARMGSAPRAAGTRMVITADSITGTIGGGCFEAEVIRKARTLLAASAPSAMMRVDLTGRERPDPDGTDCGGVMDLFLEVHA